MNTGRILLIDGSRSHKVRQRTVGMRHVSQPPHSHPKRHADASLQWAPTRLRWASCVMLTLKVVYSALILSGFFATIFLGTFLIISDLVLLAYGLARVIERIIWKT